MSETRLGDYVLDRKIATGGMAEIWLGRKAGPAGFTKQVVVKRILRHLSEDSKFREMFLDEARLAAQLEHPNIVQIFDLGESGGDYFIAMEYIDGWDLEGILARSQSLGRPLPPALVARIMADACVALDYAHHFKDATGQPAHLVHRDISPQNILVSKSGVVKLVDFGVAKAATSSHKTQTGAVKGKLSYMSPEQITAKPLDGRSDIFALGIVLYELLTGQRPFGHDSELLAVTAILHEQPRQPSSLTSDIPIELEHVILRALQKDPAARFQSAGEMQVALEQALRARGEILTNRDVAAWLEDIFSPTPTGAIRFHGSPVGVAGAYAPGGFTMQHATPQVTTLVQQSDASAGGLLVSAPRTVQSRRAGPGVVIALLFVLGILGAVGFGIWTYVIAPDVGPPTAVDDAAAAPGATAGTGSASTAVTGAALGTGAAVETGERVDAGAASLGDASGLGATSGTGATAGTGAGVALAGTGTGAEAGTGAAVAGTGATVDLDAGAAQAGTGAAAGTGTEAMPGTGAEPDAGATIAIADAEVPPPVDAGAAAPVDSGSAAASTDSGSSSRDAGSSSSSRSGTGTLRITLTTGGRATVYVDGSEIGSFAGARSYPVPSGSHTIRVVHSSGAEETRRVTIRSGDTESLSLSF